MYGKLDSKEKLIAQLLNFEILLKTEAVVSNDINHSVGFFYIESLFVFCIRNNFFSDKRIF